MMRLSVIIAIFNRKEELKELLESFEKQIVTPFEILIIDDGSTEDLSPIIDMFTASLPLLYFKKENSGPGLSRNYGATKATGDYLLFLDSDCLVPEEYISSIHIALGENKVDAFGGSDSARFDFNTIQKAISYSMTSILTTGGIRGKSKAVTKFQPRSFNMGISKKVFEFVGGFSDLRIGEDPDLSLRLWENGYTTAYFPSVTVFHKRRNTLKSFALQVYRFGIARPILNQRHPKHTKIVFWFPTFFSLSMGVSLVLAVASVLFHSTIGALPLALFILYFIAIFIDATFQNKSLSVGFWAVISTFIQHFAYGLGYLRSWWQIHLLKKKPKDVFPSHFYQ